tara:strand:+ start:1091 stop:1522 length:432 start_codon:yes stop_codon:yes gene_type:complete
MERDYHIQRVPRYSNIWLCTYVISIIIHIISSTAILTNTPNSNKSLWLYTIFFCIYNACSIIAIPAAFRYDDLLQFYKKKLIIIDTVWLIGFCLFKPHILNYYMSYYYPIIVLFICNLFISFSIAFYFFFKKHHRIEYIPVEV